MDRFYDSKYWKKIENFWKEPDWEKSCAFGLPTLAMRNQGKAWCGYVGVPKGHPLWGKKSIEFPGWGKLPLGKKLPLSIFAIFGKEEGESEIGVDLLFNVHGGITWNQDHLPGEKPDGKYWWFGFDCLHAGDLSPRDCFEAAVRGPEMDWKMGNEYRDLEYCRREIRELARQLALWPESILEQRIERQDD